MATSWTAPRIALAVIVAMIAYRCGGILNSSSGAAAPTRPAASQPAALEKSDGASESSQWVYQLDHDQMTGRNSPVASLSSQNTLALEFPYAGENRGTLVAQAGKAGKPNVYFQIDRGQIICHTDDCPIEVKFNDEPPIRFSGTKPADHSSNAVFLSNPAKFVEKAKKSTSILVQFNAYQNGSPVLRFYPAQPLTWPPQ